MQTLASPFRVHSVHTHSSRSLFAAGQFNAVPFLGVSYHCRTFSPLTKSVPHPCVSNLCLFGSEPFPACQCLRIALQFFSPPFHAFAYHGLPFRCLSDLRGAYSLLGHASPFQRAAVPFYSLTVQGRSTLCRFLAVRSASIPIHFNSGRTIHRLSVAFPIIAFPFPLRHALTCGSWPSAAGSLRRPPVRGTASGRTPAFRPG